MKVKINLNILIFIFIFSILSFISISSSLIYTSKDLGNLAIKQIIWYLIGFIFVFFMRKLGNKNLFRMSFRFYVIGILSLIFLLVFAKPINNSRCWIIIPGIGSVQPSEFMKIFLILFLANIISKFKKEKDVHSYLEEFIFIIKTAFIVLIPSILTFLQPDTGAVLIYLIIYITMMFFSGIRIRWFVFLGIILILVSSLFFGIYFYNENLFINLFGTSFYYRLERIFMWKEGIGLQLENAISAIGSSGLFGYGYKKTPIYFPEAATDFIFAITVSNFGFIGFFFCLILFILFDYYILNLLSKTYISQNKFALAGVLGMLLFQQIQNIGMTIGLLPIMGITLPFISYGGSSLLSYMIIVGLIINTASEEKKYYQ